MRQLLVLALFDRSCLVAAAFTNFIFPLRTVDGPLANSAHRAVRLPISPDTGPFQFRSGSVGSDQWWYGLFSPAMIASSVDWSQLPGGA
jgi:hypothetical protein